jgi:hypothetical protein
LPTHWLGRALGPSLDELDEPLPVAPELVEPLLPEPIEPEPLAPEPVLPPTLGLVVELPVLPLLPEVCAHEALARPSSAAATAALSVFTITMYAPLVER